MYFLITVYFILMVTTIVLTAINKFVFGLDITRSEVVIFFIMAFVPLVNGFTAGYMLANFVELFKQRYHRSSEDRWVRERHVQWTGNVQWFSPRDKKE